MSGEPTWACACQGTACFCRPAINACAVPFSPLNYNACGGGALPTYQWSGTSTWPPTAPQLSDDDVERIANRVVELMKADR